MIIEPGNELLVFLVYEPAPNPTATWPRVTGDKEGEVR